MWRLCLLTMCLVAAGARAAPAEEFQGCVVPGGNFADHRMSVNETFNTGPDPCMTYTCHEPGYYTALTCPGLAAWDGCEIVPGDSTGAYPACCPTVSCSENILGVDQPRLKAEDGVF